MRKYLLAGCSDPPIQIAHPHLSVESLLGQEVSFLYYPKLRRCVNFSQCGGKGNFTNCDWWLFQTFYRHWILHFNLSLFTL